MGRHEAIRPSVSSRASKPIREALNRLGVSKFLKKIPKRQIAGFALSSALALVTVIDPYFGSLTSYAAQTEYVNYFADMEEGKSVTVSLTRGGYEVVTGSAATKVFVELAEIPSADTVQAIAYSKMAKFGWGIDQYSCLVKLWNRESNWRVNAFNSGSGAYGIPQALPGNKMAVAGADWMTNPETQIIWGVNYIAGRYGAPCAALSHSNQHNWY